MKDLGKEIKQTEKAIISIETVFSTKDIGRMEKKKARAASRGRMMALSIRDHSKMA